MASCFPGDDKCSRGRSDDPRRGLRLHGGLQVRLSVHHQENPQPHPGDAKTPPHPTAGGDVLAAPEDGRLLPHLFPAERRAVLQGHVPNGLQKVLGRPQAPSLGLKSLVGWWQNQGPTVESASQWRRWLQSYGPCRGISSCARFWTWLQQPFDNSNNWSTSKPFKTPSQQTGGWRGTFVFTWKWWNFIWHVRSDLHYFCALHCCVFLNFLIAFERLNCQITSACTHTHTLIIKIEGLYPKDHAKVFLSRFLWSFCRF